MYVPRTVWEQLWPNRGLPMLFVHTPKCGGTFVNRSFGRRFRRCISLTEPSMAGHLTWQEYRDALAALGRSIDDYVTFSVIRDPWSWHKSWYHYIRNDKDGRHSGFPEEYRLFQKFSFDDYLRWIDAHGPVSRSKQYYLMQVQDWVIDEAGNLAVPNILRQENLRNDLIDLRDRYKLRLRIPAKRLNTSSQGDYRRFYSDEGAEIVARRHAGDIARFGYRFDG